MQLKPEQLTAHLARDGLAAVYVITGDEPLQVQEAADRLRHAAREDGFSDRQVFEVQQGFDWGRLGAEADALSLFADKRVFDLRIPGGKPGRDGAAALVEYAADPPPDTLLLVTLPRLDRAQRNSKWFRSLDKAGRVITVWPVEARALPAWLKQRARAFRLDLAPDALAFLAGQTEGNLLAAAQEIEKLALLHEGETVGLEAVMASVAGSARYSVFELADSALDGAGGRSLRILAGLRGEGTPALVVLWSLTRELRVLLAVSHALAHRRDPGRALAAHKVWERRHGLVTMAARRRPPGAWQRLLRLCAQADRAAKGRDAADPWQLLEDIVTGMVADTGQPASA
jgi:DNA polymerase-3 subunit delta